MKAHIFLILIIAGYLNVLGQRSTISLNSDWKHGEGSEANIISESFDDSSWETVTIPHTWNGLDGQDGGDDYFRGEKWYRKSFTAEKEWTGKKVFLKFGSAFLKTRLFVNGDFVGEHVGGYAAFIFDITEYLNIGQTNTLAVSVNNAISIDAPPLSGDFTMFGGISREVSLLITEPVFISPLDFASPGVYITPHDITNSSAGVKVEVLAGNHQEESVEVEMDVKIYDQNGTMVESDATTKTITSKTIQSEMVELEVSNPSLWKGRVDPYLYQVEVSLSVNGELKDQVIEPLGFRTFNVDADNGFFLNGEPYELHGVCHHEDRKDIGRGISDDQRKEDLDILYDMGCTYLRLTHYQHGAFTYDYCDSIGMVLSTEVPLVNKISSSTFFRENSRSQLKELIKQNYNHPSVMFWGMFNEINFHEGPDPTDLIGDLHELSHQLDPSRLTTGAAQNDEADTHWLLDVMGWNKYLGWYESSYNDFDNWANWLRSRHPTTKISMSEYGVGASINHHEQNPERPDPGGRFHPEEYQNAFHEAYWQVISSEPYMWSSAIWVGFDFASDWRAEGENLGINDKGMITRDRKVKKDAFYFYKANWTTEPFVYITSRRHYQRFSPETGIKVYGNCLYVTGELNGESLGVKQSDNHIFTWEEVSLKPGDNVLKIQGITSNGDFVYDSCVWNFKQRADTLLPGDIQINFQTPTSTTPSGYLADTGLEYGDRGNGYSYGWNFDNTANSRERTSTNDPLFNTLNHFQKTATDGIWEIELDNGYYQVSIGAGDPDFVDSNHKLNVENVLFIEGKNTYEAMVRTTDTIQVQDSKLTIESAPGAANPKINVIHIKEVDPPVNNEPTDTTSTVLKNDRRTGKIKANFDQPNRLLTVRVGNGQFIETITIHNTVGQLVYHQEAIQSELCEIKTTGIQSGIYVVRAYLEGQPYQSLKLMID